MRRATDFYRDLFGIEPVMTTPRYVPLEVAPGVLFALWSGRSGEVTPRTPRTPRCCEAGLMVPGPAAVDEIYAARTARGVTVAGEPHDEVSGRTFVNTDPDGNLIRVSPAD